MLYVSIGSPRVGRQLAGLDGGLRTREMQAVGSNMTPLVSSQMGNEKAQMWTTPYWYARGKKVSNIDDTWSKFIG